jgi:SAM-dependent methyltransferase
MGSATVQGDLWGQEPVDWTYIMEPVHIPIWNAMLNAAEVGTGTHILDAGCGGGGASVIATNRGARVSGLDAAEGLIMIARERVPKGDFRVGDIEFLPFDDETFDVVFAASSIQYSEDQVAVLRELRRVCKPNGRIVVAMFGTPDKVEFRTIFKAISDTLPEPPSRGGPFALSDPGILEGLIAQAGLNVLKSGLANCLYEFPDFDLFWRATVAGGPVQAVIRVVGEEKLKKSIQKAVEPYQNGTGVIRIEPNMFRYIVATL